MKQGNIGVTSENIFPVIKKFLYSYHEIFLREIVSNAVDATQKLKTLASALHLEQINFSQTELLSYNNNTSSSDIYAVTSENIKALSPG